MKINPKNKRSIKSTTNPQETKTMGSVIEEIAIKFPSMPVDLVIIGARTICSQPSARKRIVTATDGLIHNTVIDLAKDLVINYGGSTFVEGRSDAMTQTLLRMWATPNNQLEIGRFLKVLTQGRSAWEKAAILLSELSSTKRRAKPRTK